MSLGKHQQIVVSNVIPSLPKECVANATLPTSKSLPSCLQSFSSSLPLGARLDEAYAEGYVLWLL